MINNPLVHCYRKSTLVLSATPGGGDVWNLGLTALLAVWLQKSQLFLPPPLIDRRRLVHKAVGFSAIGVTLGHISNVSAEISGDQTLAHAVDAQRDRPGQYSRKEDIASWQVKNRPHGFEGDFKHKQNRLSGTVTVTYGGDTSSTILLGPNSDRYQVAFNGRAISGTDERGKAFAATWDRDRRWWQADRQSELTANRSKRDFRLGIAVMLDLEPDGDARSSVQSGDESQIVAQRV